MWANNNLPTRCYSWIGNKHPHTLPYGIAQPCWTIPSVTWSILSASRKPKAINPSEGRAGQAVSSQLEEERKKQIGEITPRMINI